MMIFLSWSGKNSHSHKVAMVLHGWLPKVIKFAKPWISSSNIDTGLEWNSVVDKKIAEADFGVLSITDASKQAPWLVYEAGALSKLSGKSTVVCPYFFETPATDLGPLAKFQGEKANRDGTLNLVKAINQALSEKEKLPLPELMGLFELHWLELEKELALIAFTDDIYRTLSDRDILEELLLLNRLQRKSQDLPDISLTPAQDRETLVQRGYSLLEKDESGNLRKSTRSSLHYDPDTKKYYGKGRLVL